MNLSGTTCRAFCAALLVWAAAPRLEATPPMRFERLGADDGLSQGAVNAIVQDAQGFMWFGTENGATRYDGRELTPVRRDRADPASLPNNWISDITPDASGRLWFATDGGGVAWRDPRTGSFHPLPGDIARVRTVLADRAGRLWIGSRDSGLGLLLPGARQPVRFRHAIDDAATLSHDAVYALLEDRRGDIWIGTGGGLDRMQPDRRRIERIALPGAANGTPPRVRSLAQDHAGFLWIGTDAGLMRLDPADRALTVLRHDPARPDSLPDDRVQTVFADSAQRLWIGTLSGLALYDAERRAFTTLRHNRADTSSLPDDYVISIFEDRGGLIWIGTKSRGLAKWNPRTWSFGYHAPGSADSAALDNVTSFTEDADGRLWIGSFGGGLARLDRRSGEVTRVRHDAVGSGALSDGRVMALLTDRQDRIWIGTMGGGLDRLDAATGRVTVFRRESSDPHSLPADGVMSLLEDSQGRLWVGTYGGGLARLDGDGARFAVYRPSPEDPRALTGDRVTALAEDAAGRLWVGTDGSGLSVLDPEAGVLRRFRHDPHDAHSLGADVIYALHAEADGTMWVGTRGAGLDRIRLQGSDLARADIENFAEAQGLPDATVYGIRPDRSGGLWVSTNHGLARFDPAAGSARAFHRSHGLQGEEFNFGAHFRSRSGELFFGGANGFNAFHAERLAFNGHAPPVVLTKVLELNAPMRSTTTFERLGALALDHRDDVVTFEFAALDFAAPQDNRYAYRLEGFDRDWISAGTRPIATYTDLPGGRYTLRVRAANDDGVWNETGLALAVTVAPPPWLTAWAYVGYAAAFGLLLYGVWAAQQRKLAREASYNRRLQDEVRTRTAELAERNAELENANLRLREASITDPLTGLGNRRFVREAMPRLLHSASNEGSTTCTAVLIVDLDYFKPVNDAFGHEAGDQVLIQVAAILKANVRGDDLVARWGGDEFVILCRSPDLAHAAVLAERIRAQVASCSYHVADGCTARTSCSLGLALHPFVPEAPDRISLEQTLVLADCALQQAKRCRNAWTGWRGTARAQAAEALFEELQRDCERLEQAGLIEVRRGRPQTDETIIERLLAGSGRRA
ncbi:MAG TPA: two-component regulator propeller domain-containing protein [Steroidobacteraceae bacterium]|nr:two-component regulator propeller domain-containing protein [Steroidobacteraceae bacterium]